MNLPELCQGKTCRSKHVESAVLNRSIFKFLLTPVDYCIGLKPLKIWSVLVVHELKLVASHLLSNFRKREYRISNRHIHTGGCQERLTQRFQSGESVFRGKQGRSPET